MMVSRRRAAGLSAFFVSVLLGALPSAEPARAYDLILTDNNTGLAISGFDPVAYFLFGEPREGNGRFEARQGGAVWRFLSEANRAAFEAQPEVYGPRYGGHDPVSASRGFVAEGDPLIFLIADNRLYLFHSLDTLAAFKASQSNIVARADRNWPRLVANLWR